jgi:hypothetical protein
MKNKRTAKEKNTSSEELFDVVNLKAIPKLVKLLILFKTLRSQLAEAMELLSMCEIPSDPARIDEWRHRVEQLENEIDV